jgi:hypothetical protein
MSLARLEPHKESVPDAIRAFGLYFFKIREFNVSVERHYALRRSAAGAAALLPAG